MKNILIEKVHQSAAEHMIEVNFLEKQLADRKRELAKLEAMQKKEPVNQDLLDILQCFSDMDEFLHSLETQKDMVITPRVIEQNIKKSAARLTDSRDIKPASERYETSEDEYKDLKDNNDDLFMVDQPMQWQRTSDVGNKRL